LACSSQTVFSLAFSWLRVTSFNTCDYLPLRRDMQSNSDFLTSYSWNSLSMKLYISYSHLTFFILNHDLVLTHYALCLIYNKRDNLTVRHLVTSETPRVE